MKSILSQQKQVSNANNSNAIICKSKNIFRIFVGVSGIYIKFGKISKKKKKTLIGDFFLKL